MKVQQIPAQMTTVEDKIAGNLSFTQLLLLIVPVIWFMLLFAFMPQIMQLSALKFFLFLPVCSISLLLALRVKEKLVLEWIMLLLRYYLRPTYYVVNKNDLTLRKLESIEVIQTAQKLTIQELQKQSNERPSTNKTLSQIFQLNQFLTNHQFSFSMKSTRKGGVYVAFTQKYQ